MPFRSKEEQDLVDEIFKNGILLDPPKALRYNEGKLKWNLLPLEAMEDTIRVLMYGAHKYSLFEGPNGEKVRGADISPEDAKGLKLIRSGANNWRGGDGWTVEEWWNSMMRHIVALRSGEEIDPESGLPHMGHIGCNFIFISWLSKYKKKITA